MMPVHEVTPANRHRYRAILELYDLKQGESAAEICKHTSRPCAVRTVRAWLAEPDKPSANPCPDWAIKTLLESQQGKPLRFKLGRIHCQDCAAASGSRSR